MKILPIFITILALSTTSTPNIEAIDGSLSNKEYFKKGVPKRIEGLDDLVSAYNTLWTLSDNNESCLPRYNSPKSQVVFEKLFNKHQIKRVLSKDLPSQEKRVMLTKLRTIYSDFSAMYDMKNQNHIYDNESVRIFSLSAYAFFLTFSLIDDEIRVNNIDLKNVWEDPQEKILFMTKMIGRDLGALNYSIKTNKRINKQTKEKIKKDYDEYESLVKSIKFLDYENNIKKIGSLY